VILIETKVAKSIFKICKNKNGGSILRQRKTWGEVYLSKGKHGGSMLKRRKNGGSILR